MPCHMGLRSIGPRWISWEIHMVVHGKLCLCGIAATWQRNLLQVLIQNGLVGDLEVLVLWLPLVLHVRLRLILGVKLRHELSIVQMLIVHLLLARAGHQRCGSTSLVLHLLHIGLHWAGILEHHVRARYQTSLIGTPNQCRVVQLLSLSLHHLHDLVIG